ncbi:hypothetical protein [Streptomyces albospinus]|nr:hypothetical protein [Streptomyces albospinus]
MDEVPPVLRGVLAQDKAERAARVLTSEEAVAFANWPRVRAEAETRWLAAVSGDDGLLGFEPPARPDSAWILHAMYEDLRSPAPPADADAATGTERTGDEDDEDETDWAAPPRPHWQCLRWSELAGRVGDPVVEEGSYPDRYPLSSCHSEPRGRSDDILWSNEGSLDWETWHQLIDVLMEYSSDGPDTR